jgi:hypothetical protein
MLPGETVMSGADLPYPRARPKVLQSAAGFFIGFVEADGSPYSRETEYMDSYRAEEMLDGWMKLIGPATDDDSTWVTAARGLYDEAMLPRARY